MKITNPNLRLAGFFTLCLMLQLTPLQRSWAENQSHKDEPRLSTRPRYKIQPGDKFDVTYRYTPELNQTVTVGPDGYVDIDSTGPLKVSELTVEEATERITLLSAKRLREPKVTLTLKDFHKPFYVVAGEVGHPGRFDMDQPTTAMQALLLAGGMNASARSSQIIVFRRIDTANDEVHVIDLHNVKKRSDLERDLMLEPGDMLLVPRNRLANMERVIKAANLGLYLNPGNLGF